MTKLAQLTVSGLSLGAAYALVSLGFVIVLRSSRLLNLFHPGFVLLGGYLAYNARATWSLPFAAAVVVSLVAVALIGLAVERVVIERLAGADVSSTILVTVGLLLATEPIVDAVWGPTERLDLDDPWGLRHLSAAGVSITERDVAVILLTAIVLTAFFLLFRYSGLGVAMRAAADDPEAASAIGIDARFVLRVAWAVAGLLGGLAGVMASTAVGGGVRPGLVAVGFAALPGLILGGINSPGGAVLGGVLVGLAQQYTAGYAPAWAGGDFATVMPYVVLLAVLLVRPTGLVGGPRTRFA